MGIIHQHFRKYKLAIDAYTKSHSSLPERETIFEMVNGIHRVIRDINFGDGNGAWYMDPFIHATDELIDSITETRNSIDYWLQIMDKTMNKTAVIKGMFIDEFPASSVIKNDFYQNHDSPFRAYRDGVGAYAHVTRTNGNSKFGVSFYDPDLDIDDIDKFIKTLVNKDPSDI